MGTNARAAWSRGTAEAALRLTPYEEGEEPAAEPDTDAAVETLELRRAVLRPASQGD